MGIKRLHANLQCFWYIPRNVHKDASNALGEVEFTKFALSVLLNTYYRTITNWLNACNKHLFTTNVLSNGADVVHI